jgi:hypothetical protein
MLNFYYLEYFHPSIALPFFCTMLHFFSKNNSQKICYVVSSYS